MLGRVDFRGGAGGGWSDGIRSEVALRWGGRGGGLLSAVEGGGMPFSSEPSGCGAVVGAPGRGGGSFLAGEGGVLLVGEGGGDLTGGCGAFSGRDGGE